jgi:hypothetical protein
MFVGAPTSFVGDGRGTAGRAKERNRFGTRMFRPVAAPAAPGARVVLAPGRTSEF